MEGGMGASGIMGDLGSLSRSRASSGTSCCSPFSHVTVYVGRLHGRHCTEGDPASEHWCGVHDTSSGFPACSLPYWRLLGFSAGHPGFCCCAHVSKTCKLVP